MTARYLFTGVLMPAFAIALVASEPAKVDPRPPAPSTLPTFTGDTPDSGASTDLSTPPVFVLPGATAPAPAETVAVVRTPAPPLPPPADDKQPPVLRRPEPKLPADLEKDPAVFLQRRIGAWTSSDARKILGEPVRDRPAVDSEKNVDGHIYTFSDPSRRYREFELDFSQETGKLRSVFVYPWKMKWDDCRRLWGSNVTTSETANGRNFHSYESRRLDVLVDSAGAVISIGLY